MSWTADLRRCKEIQENHYKKLALAKPVLQTQKRKQKLAKEFDPDSMATAARATRAPRASSRAQETQHAERSYGPAGAPLRDGTNRDATKPVRRKQSAASRRAAEEQLERQRKRQEAALEKHHRRTGRVEGEPDQASEPVLSREERREQMEERRRQRLALEERNEAAREKHAERQRLHRQRPAGATTPETSERRKISTAPESGPKQRPSAARVPRVANLDRKVSRKWVTVAESTPDKPTEPNASSSAPASAGDGAQTDRKILRSRLAEAEQTIVHLRNELHDIKTRDVVYKPVEVEETDDVDEAANNAKELESTRAELARVRVSYDRVHVELAVAMRKEQQQQVMRASKM